MKDTSTIDSKVTHAIATISDSHISTSVPEYKLEIEEKPQIGKGKRGVNRYKAKRKPSSMEEQACQRSMANVRERQRTQSLNDAFSKLRTIVPTLPQDKMSKIRTLQLASEYIRFLDEFLSSTSESLPPSAPMDNMNLHYAFNMWRMETCNVVPSSQYWYPQTTPSAPFAHPGVSVGVGMQFVPFYQQNYG